MASVEEIFRQQPEIKREDVRHLKEWLSKQLHLPPVSDYQLVGFLFSCKGSLELTKNCIDAYFTVKTGTPEFFTERDPLSSEMQMAASVVQIAPLSGRSIEGNRYIIGRLIDYDASHFILNSSIKMLFMVIDATLRYSVTTPGVVFIYDMKGIQLSHVTRLNPVSIKKYIIYLAEAMPIRLQAIHIINVNPAINSIMALMKPFLNKDQLQKIQFHAGDESGLTEFHKFVPQKMMPRDYGGQDETLDYLSSRTHELLVSYRGWFEEEATLLVEEARRVGKMRTAGTIFGMDGSFKRLDID